MRRVVQLLLLCAVVSAVTSRVVHTQVPDTKAAQTSIEAWLSLVDGQKHAASWDTAASVFKNAVTQEQWSAAVQKARAPLGQVKSRTLKGSTVAKPQTAPEGEYLVFQFETTFEQRASAVEMVTAFKETDGSWRVAGYFIK